MLNPNALITLSSIKSHLGILESKVLEDSILELFINSASQFIESYCERILRQVEYIEYFNGSYGRVIITKQWPINSVTSIKESATGNWSGSEAVAASRYSVSSDKLSIKLDFDFPRRRSNVQVIYNAGFSPVPADLQLAATWATEWYYRHRQRVDIGKVSSSKGDESIGILAEMPKQVFQILNSYKRFEMPIIDD
jgi:hypothetical protein